MLTKSKSPISSIGTIRRFMKEGTWSEAVMGVVDDSYATPMKLEEGAAGPLAGGLLQNGYQCGMLWGAALAVGAQAYRQYGPGAQAETQAVIATQRMTESFRQRNRSINCSEITHILWKGSADKQMMAQVLKFFLKGGPVVCFSMVASYAKVAAREIEHTFSETENLAACSPASCAAELARKMGASELHTVMAAGFAGGIGLSGGACGALGAAVWLLGMQASQQSGAKPPYNNPLALAALERYLESSDYEFECAKVAGRKFENVAEHSEYLRQGGCAHIIEALAVGQWNESIYWKPFYVMYMADLNILAGLLSERKITPLIDRIYPLSEIVPAMRYVKDTHAQGKVVITMV